MPLSRMGSGWVISGGMIRLGLIVLFLPKWWCSSALPIIHRRTIERSLGVWAVYCEFQKSFLSMVFFSWLIGDIWAFEGKGYSMEFGMTSGGRKVSTYYIHTQHHVQDEIHRYIEEVIAVLSWCLKAVVFLSFFLLQSIKWVWRQRMSDSSSISIAS